jgi:hypothetical protein
MTKQEFEQKLDKLWDTKISQETKDLLWNLFNDGLDILSTNASLDIVDYSSECSMCGKPMPYRFCGMCPHCEMMWND